jgi:hypothetical protein
MLEMPLLLGLSILLQFICLVHVVRTGRPYWWILIILMGSFLGVAVYAFTQMLPDLQHDPRARRAARGLAKKLDPQKDLRRLRDELARADTVQNRLHLGHEFLEFGEAGEAEAVFRDCLKGMYATDPDILLALAKAQFAQHRIAEAHATLSTLIAANPGYKSADGHLLYARTLEGLDRLPEALAEYDVLDESYPGEEARVRKAELLLKLDRKEDARATLQKSLERTRIAPAYYRKAQSEWIERARKLM